MEERRRRGLGRPFGDGEGDGETDPGFGAGQSFGGSFETRSQSRPFEDLGRLPFEPPQPVNPPYETSHPHSGAFQPPEPVNRQFESSQPQSRSFEARGNGRPKEAEKPTPRPPMETRRREPEPAERRSRTPFFVAGGLVALLVATAAGIVVMSRSSDPVSTAAASPTARPSAQVPVVGSARDKYGFAASRKTDPQPLTLKELFGRKKVTTHGRSYLMTVRRADKKCKDAVHGTGMQKALTAGQCTQFLRASFRDAPGKLIGTVGVANLKTATSAKKAAKAGTGGELQDYVSPLQGKDSATKFLGSGGDSYATAWSQGHYLVLLWFQYKDGHKPSKAELKRLNGAAVDITETSVFSALDTRALTGARSN
ncbi:MAG: hypothetical protein JWQ95_4558 [Sphaerisporangium sp.]|jgi:hypothetical protein|nr:hypothetical protein [Sphaerisporangium sp.]